MAHLLHKFFKIINVIFSDQRLVCYVIHFPAINSVSLLKKIFMSVSHFPYFLLLYSYGQFVLVFFLHYSISLQTMLQVIIENGSYDIYITDSASDLKFQLADTMTGILVFR